MNVPLPKPFSRGSHDIEAERRRLAMMQRHIPISAIVDDNVLLRPSAGTRAKTYGFLRGCFALDPRVPCFALLRFLWTNDKTGRPLLNQATLHYELSTFVCDGEYEAGLIRTLHAYLKGLHLQNQKAAWVSGLYGSGKSHLVKVLEAFWRNDTVLNGQLPCDIARLPDEIQHLLKEISKEAKRAGGIWSASGMLSAF